MGDRKIILSNLYVADTFFSRAIGLLGKESLPPGSGILLSPCNQIHTFFMKFPIDVIFIDGHGKVIKVYNALPPWRITSLLWRSRSVIEMMSDGRCEINEGDVLAIEDKKLFKLM